MKGLANSEGYLKRYLTNPFARDRVRVYDFDDGVNPDAWPGWDINVTV
jgi:hypothetical protein